jgi:hypothetical protein
MIDQFYVGREGKKFGPFSTSKLRALAAAGKLRPTDAIWKPGMDKAVRAAKVRNLFPLPKFPLSLPDATAVEATQALSSPAPSGPPCVSSLEGAGEDRITYLDGSVEAVRPLALAKEITEKADKSAPMALVPQESPVLAAPASQEKAGLQVDLPSRQPLKPRKRIAVGLKGALVLSQDGYRVLYRKKCSQCGFEDTGRSTMLISTGTTRSHFFCPKCRKSREVQIQGTMQ